MCINNKSSAHLNDDMGGILEGVKFSAHLTKTEPGKPDHLNRIEELLTEGGSALRDIIWILDDNADTAKQFMERGKKFIPRISAISHVHLECIVEAGLKEKYF